MICTLHETVSPGGGRCKPPGRSPATLAGGRVGVPSLRTAVLASHPGRGGAAPHFRRLGTRLLGNWPPVLIIFTHKLKKDIFPPKFKLALSHVEPNNLVFLEHKLLCPRITQTWMGPAAPRVLRPVLRPWCYFWPASPPAIFPSVFHAASERVDAPSSKLALALTSWKSSYGLFLAHSTNITSTPKQPH